MYGLTGGSPICDFLDDLMYVRRWEGPWCTGGDFNEVRNPSERSGGGRRTRGMREFGEFID